MSSGDTDRTHPRECDVFIAACEVVKTGDAADLASYLDQACGDDTHLRKRVETLIRYERETDELKPPEPWVAGAIDEYKTIALAANRDAGEISAANSKIKRSTGFSEMQWEPPAPETLSELLEGYRIEEMIGRGGMGAVYRGEQQSLQRPVAVKILPPEFGDDEAFAERFRREALAMAKMDHPNIVTIFDFGSVEFDEGCLYYIVMEFIDGTDLYQLIASRELTPEAALGLIGSICDALQYAHGEGYVHRDVKPANVFITKTGIVKVGDFGLAKLTGLKEEDSGIITMAGHVMGTPHYLAPETLEDSTMVDHRADIFSLGVMFYQMLTGTLPRGAFQPPSKKVAVDARLDEIVLKAMETEPSLRYQHASEVKNDVTSVTSTSVRSIEKRDRIPSTKRLRSSVVLAGIVSLLLISWGAWFFLKDGPHKPRQNVEPAAVGTNAEKQMEALKWFFDLPEKSWADFHNPTTTLGIRVHSLAELPKKFDEWNLTQIRTDSPDVEDSDLERFAVFPHLESVEINYSKLTGEGFKFLKNLPIHSISLIAQRHLTDQGHRQIAALKTLTKLQLSGANVTPQALDELASLPNLEDIRFRSSTTTFQDEAALIALSKLKSIRILSLTGCELTDRAIPHLIKMSQLNELYLTENPKISDEALLQLASLKNLTTLVLNQTGSPEGVRELVAKLHGTKVTYTENGVELQPLGSAPLTTKSVTVSLPIPTRELPDPVTLPKGRLRFLGERMIPGDMVKFNNEPKFVEVHVNGNLGWFALKADGTVVSGRATEVREKYRREVSTLGRAASSSRGDWISANGELIIRTHNARQALNFIPKSGIADYAYAYRADTVFVLENDGTFSKVDAEGNITHLTEFDDLVAIEPNHKSIWGLRSTGQLVHVEGDLTGNPDRIRDVKFSKIISSDFSLMGLDTEGGVWKSGAEHVPSHHPTLNSKGPMIDITFEHGIDAARQANGQWIAFSTIETNQTIVKRLNEIAPNSSSLAMVHGGAIWLETDPEEELVGVVKNEEFQLPVPTRELIDPTTRPAGKVYTWGHSADGSKYPIGDHASLSDFVSIQLYNDNGWIGLRQTGDIAGWESRNGSFTRHRGKNVWATSRSSFQFTGDFLSRDGKILERDRPNPVLWEALQGEIIVDLAIAELKGRPSEYSALRSDGSIIIVGQDNLPPSAMHRDFVRIEGTGGTTFGIREDGRIVCWGTTPAEFEKMQEHRFVELSANGHDLIALTTRGQIWRADSNIVHPVHHLPPGTGAVTDIQAGYQIFLARRASDQRWVAWNGGGTSDDKIRAVIEKVATLGPNVESIYAHASPASLVWIESSP